MQGVDSLRGLSSEGARDLTMDPNSRHVAPKPRKAATKPRSMHPKRSLSILEQKAQDHWLSQSVGRMQTAVVDYCLASFAGHTRSEPFSRKRSRLPGRSTSTAIEASSLPTSYSENEDHFEHGQPFIDDAGDESRSPVQRQKSQDGHVELRRKQADDSFGRFINPFEVDVVESFPKRTMSVRSEFFSLGEQGRPKTCGGYARIEPEVTTLRIMIRAQIVQRPKTAPLPRLDRLDERTLRKHDLTAFVTPKRRLSAKARRSIQDPSRRSSLRRIPEHAAVDYREEDRAKATPEDDSRGALQCPIPLVPQDFGSSTMSRSASRGSQGCTTLQDSRCAPKLDPLKLAGNADSVSSNDSIDQANPQMQREVDQDEQNCGVSSKDSTVDESVTTSSQFVHSPIMNQLLDSPTSCALDQWASPPSTTILTEIHSNRSSVQACLRSKTASSLGNDFFGSQETIRPAVKSGAPSDHFQSWIQDHHNRNCEDWFGQSVVSKPFGYEDLNDDAHKRSQQTFSHAHCLGGNHTHNSAHTATVTGMHGYANTGLQVQQDSPFDKDELSDFSYLSAAII